jgi:8-oxo-dGTP pyrophosphatase MutT (NUDIX family)
MKTKLKPWTIKKSKQILKDRWINVRADKCVNEVGATYDPYYVMKYPDWAYMVVLDSKNNILITRQYRHGAGKVFAELPCGTIDPKDKSPLSAAKRELLEETGYTGKFIKAGRIYPNPAVQANLIHCFLVTDAKQVTIPQEDPYELLEYEPIKLNQLKKMIEQGKFPQALHLASLLMGLKKANKVKLVF